MVAHAWMESTNTRVHAHQAMREHTVLQVSVFLLIYNTENVELVGPNSLEKDDYGMINLYLTLLRSRSTLKYQYIS